MAERWWGVAFSVVLVCEAMLFVPFVGFNADEVMFLGPLFPPHLCAVYWNSPLGHVPLMLMPYLGATKSLAYSWLSPLLPPGPLAVRLPVVLLSCLTLYLFLRLVSRVADRRTAIVATALLATDTTFVLTTSLDWGPAAVQIFGCVMLANLALRAVERPRAVVLAAAGFVAGFLVWNKAVFLFSLAGALVAAGIVFRDRIKQVRLRAIPALACGFIAGSLPLVVFNASSGMATWRVRETLQSYSLGYKIVAAVSTLDASAFNGYMFENSPALRHDVLPVALLASALVLPWTGADKRRRRLLQFVWMAGLFTFLTMLPFRNAGAGPQHIVLLYPLPQLIVAATFIPAVAAAGWLRKAGVWVVTAVTCAGVLLTVAYRLQMSANGLTVYWTDAIYGLARELRTEQATDVVAADWGIEEPLRALSEGRIRIVADRIPSAALRANGGRNLRIVKHGDGFTLYPERLRTLEESARAAEVRLVPAAHVMDAHGRVMFEVFSLGRPTPALVPASPGRTAEPPSRKHR